MCRVRGGIQEFDMEISVIFIHTRNNFYRCTEHSDIHTVQSPTDAHLLELQLNLH